MALSRLGWMLAAGLTLTGCNLAAPSEDRADARVERDDDGDGQESRAERDDHRRSQARGAERNRVDDRDAPSSYEDEPDRRGGELASSRRPPPADGITREWFAGSWTDSGDCADAADFNRDGRFRLADGGRGMWNVQDGRLIVDGGNGRTAVRLRRIDSDTMDVLHDDGSVGRSTRC